MGLRHPVVNIDAMCIEYMGFRVQFHSLHSEAHRLDIHTLNVRICICISVYMYIHMCIYIHTHIYAYDEILGLD